jgi:site-specific DNA-methyltransferase (adenine-specific)
MNNTIINGDCLEAMKTIPDKHINLIVIDLPYGQTNCDWDICIDLNLMWIQLKRILKDNGQVVFFCTTKFGVSIINSNPLWFRYDLIWSKEKGQGFLDANKKPLRKHEMLYLFHNDKKSKGVKWTYNPQKTEGTPYKTKGNSTIISVYGTKNTSTINNTGYRYPTSIQHFGYDKEKIHLTQKPVAICEWLIKTYSNEGDTILDFCMGSGSTVIACINTNRNYIGIEKDKDIFDKAQLRINQAIQQQPLLTMEQQTINL